MRATCSSPAIWSSGSRSRCRSPPAGSSGSSATSCFALGRFEDGDGFGLTPLALRLFDYANGVSALPTEVARGMWASLWLDPNGAEPPIEHVTNGVHLGTWLDPALTALLSRSAGARPHAAPDQASWGRARDADSDELWRVHARLKARLGERSGLDPGLRHRPQEASGTSGMKGAVNDASLGWAIGGVSDDADREQLYRLLEDEVVPTFTGDRARWVELMKTSIAVLAPQFSMHRALVEYAERHYLPANPSRPAV